MNILCVSEFFYPWIGGAELVNWMILKGLARRGHKIYVITSQIPGTAKYEEIDGIQINRPFSIYDNHNPERLVIAKRMVFMVKLYPYLNKFLNTHSVDVIYNIEYMTALPAALISSKRRIPIVTSIRSLSDRTWFQKENPYKATIGYLREKFVIKLVRFDAIQCTSDSVAKQLKNCATKVILNIPNPLDLSEVEQVSERADSGLLRQELEIKQDELFLLCVGSLLKGKNIEGLLRVLCNSKTNYKLVIIGDGPEKGNLERLVKVKGIQDKVSFLGQKSHYDTLCMMKACDIFLLSSKSETFSNVAIEALSLGRPVIATKVGVLPEIESANLYLIDNLLEIDKLLEGNIKPKEDKRILGKYPLNKIISDFEDMFQSVTASEFKQKH